MQKAVAASVDEQGVKEPLTQALILRNALELADEEGIENLSVRKLASSLNRTPMALYRHFDSMDAIKQGVLALALSEVDTAEIPGERWDDSIRRTTESIRQLHLRHGKAQLYRISASAWDPGLRDHTERVQRLHKAQGIPDETLKRMWRILDAFLSGFIVKEMTDMRRTLSIPESQNRPSWFETAEGAYSEQAFRDGIEIIIAGIREFSAPDPCEWRTPE